MVATIINGKQVADNLQQEIIKEVKQLKQQHNITPGLAVVIVGEDPASQVYVRNKCKTTQAAGMQSFMHTLDKNCTEKALLELIDSLNNDNSVHGILVQLPLPAHINSEKIINAIAVEKDVDGFHIENIGKLHAGLPSLVPCTPQGCLILLKQVLGETIAGKNAIVIGRSQIVGKPTAQLLLQESATVTIAHSKTKNIQALCREAEIIIAAVGIPKLVTQDWIQPGVTIIDVGINRIQSDTTQKIQLVGDVDFDAVQNIAGAITPVPGGVGPMTIACLLKNTLVAAKNTIQ